MKKDPKPYEYDFDGRCAPGGREWNNSWETFSVGIFQWIPKLSGKGVKRSKVVKRVRGKAVEADAVLAGAQRLVDDLNALEESVRK